MILSEMEQPFAMCFFVVFLRGEGVEGEFGRAGEFGTKERSELFQALINKPK